MENISDFYPMIFECAVNAVRVIMAIVFSLLIIPWVKKTAIPWLQEKRLYGMISRFVRAAEKLAESGTIDKASKLDYVEGLLEHSGIDISPEVHALIESAVGDLDDAFMQNMGNLAGVFIDDTGMDECGDECGEDEEEAADGEPVEEPEENGNG